MRSSHFLVFFFTVVLLARQSQAVSLNTANSIICGGKACQEGESCCGNNLEGTCFPENQQCCGCGDTFCCSCPEGSMCLPDCDADTCECCIQVTSLPGTPFVLTVDFFYLAQAAIILFCILALFVVMHSTDEESGEVERGCTCTVSCL